MMIGSLETRPTETVDVPALDQRCVLIRRAAHERSNVTRVGMSYRPVAEGNLFSSLALPSRYLSPKACRGAARLDPNISMAGYALALDLNVSDVSLVWPEPDFPISRLRETRNAGKVFMSPITNARRCYKTHAQH